MKKSSGFAALGGLVLLFVTGLFTVTILAVSSGKFNLSSLAGSVKYTPQEKKLLEKQQSESSWASRLRLTASLVPSPSDQAKAKLTAKWIVPTEFNNHTTYTYRLSKSPGGGGILSGTTDSQHFEADGLSLVKGIYAFTVHLSQFQGQPSGGLEGMVTLSWPPK